MGKARVLRDRVRSYFQAGRRVGPPARRAGGRYRRPRPGGDRHRDGSAGAREQLHQAPPAPLQRAPARRQEPSVAEADAGGGVSAAVRGAARGERRERVRRAVHPRQAGAPDRGADASHLRHPLVQGDAERPPCAAVPAVPDPPLPRAVRGRDLPARALPPGQRRRAAVPGGAHGRGRETAQGRDGGRRRERALRGGGAACATRCARWSGWTRRRRSPRTSWTTATCSGRTWKAIGRRCRCSRCATGASCRARGSCRSRWASRSASWQQSIQQYYALGREVPREVLVPAAVTDQELLEQWLSAPAGRGRAHPHPAARGEGAPAGDGRCATRGWRSTWSGAIRAASRRRSCARCATCWTCEIEPRRIECFDISNIQGSDIVASMVVLRGRPAQEVGLPEVPRAGRVGSAGRLRVHARGGGPPLSTPARGGQGAARPDPGRRRQGPALRGHGRAGRAGARAPAGREPGQARGAAVRARARRAGAASALVAGPAAGPARARRGAPLRDRLPPQDAEQAHDRVRARRHPRHRAGAAAQAALDASARCAACAGASLEELRASVGAATAARIRAHLDRG